MNDSLITERCQFLVSVHAFFMKDDQILLAERANTGYMDGFFSVPAGHVEKLEGIKDALRREISEEVGIEMKDLPEPAHVMRRIKANDERVDYFFVITKWDGELRNNEPEKCAQITWIDSNNLPEKTVPYIRFAVDQIKQGKVFSDFIE